MNTPINKEATFIHGPVGKTFTEEEMLQINPHAVKEAANHMSGYIFVWDSERELYENIGTLDSLRGNYSTVELPKIASFTMKGSFQEDHILPTEGIKPGDCCMRGKHFWAVTSEGVWKDYGDAEALPDGISNHVSFNAGPRDWERGEINYLGEYPGAYDKLPEFLPFVSNIGDVMTWRGQDWVRNTTSSWIPYSRTPEEQCVDVKEAVEPPEPSLSDKLRKEHYLEDVRAGYGGTFEQWCRQNGDLNAVLCMASGTPRSVDQLEEQRIRMHQRDLLADSKEHPSLDDVAVLLEGALTKFGNEESDAAFKALDALKKVKVDMRRKRRNAWFRRILFLLILGAIGYGLYKWIPTQVVSGRYTVPKTCSVPFGNGAITGMRYYDYGYKSLFGIHMTLESTVRESTIVSMNGQEFSIFGLSPRNEDATSEEMAVADKVLKVAEVEVETAPKPPKGKWWRMNIWTSDKGTQPMKPAELYLFASEKYTTMVAYKDFCK